MSWNLDFTKEHKPDLADIDSYVATPLWEELLSWIELTFQVDPVVEHSCCSGAPGWNVKYKKGGRSLCTLYPGAGSFICLVVVGSREAPLAELELTQYTEYTQELYRSASAMNGSRWLMMEMKDARRLEDAKRLIALRATKKLR